MRRNYIAALIGTSVMAAAPVAHGQDSQAQSVQTQGVLEQVTVTARRREESQQNVPLSMSALDAAALERVEINTMSDLQRQVPSLDLTGASPSRSMLAFSLRGQRTNEFQLLSDPPVGTYFAEVVQPRPTGFGKALFDLQSVQVLKGVQGTLFGRNMTGGAVLVEPAHPTDEFDAKLSVSAGNFELREVFGMVNLPISDSVAVRLAGKSREREGFSTDITSGRDLDDENVDAWRASLLIRPSENFESLFIYDGMQQRNNGTAVYFGHPATPNPACLATNTCRPIDLYSPPINGFLGLQDAQAIAAEQAARTGDRRTAIGSPEQIAALGGHPFENVDNWGVTNKTQYTFGDYTLKNIAGYRRLEWDQRTDMDGSILPWIYAQQTQDVTMLSEELQLQGQSGRLNWIVGAYYFREYGTDGAVSANFPELFRLAPGAGTLTAAQQAFIDVGDADAKTWAAFLAGTFELTDRWKISAGLRYTDDEREISKSPMRPNINSCVWTNRTVPLSECRFSNDASWGEWSWDATLQYQPSADRMFYGAVRHGFRSGGFSLRATSDAEFEPFNPEFVTEYELGTKNDWSFGAEAALRTNLALFYQDYTDVQRQVSRTAAGTVNTIVANTPEQEIYGGELELTYIPFDGLSIGAGYSLIKSHVLDSGGAFVRYGLVGAAENQVNVNVSYRLPIASTAGEVYANAGWFWKDDAHLMNVDAEADEPSYDLLNLKLSWERAFGSGLTVSAYANNVTDETYRIGVISLQAAGVGYTGDFYGDPRTYGVEVEYRFGNH